MDTNTFESNFPRISFQKVFIEIDRLINIGFYVDYSGSKPTLFIEADSLMHKTNSILTTADIDELKTSTDSELLFSKLSIGGNKWDENPNLSFPSSIEWLGYRSEQYNIIGNCNIDTEIDLTRDFVVDTNAIQDAVDVVNFGSEANDDDIFILHTYFDSGIIWKCEQSNFLTAGPPYYYNQYFTNNQIAGRYLGAVPNSVAFWLGAPLDATFQASSTAVYTDQVLINPSTTEPIPFQDDSNAPNFDANGNYNNATYYYTIPANGQYTFYVKLFLQLVQLSATTGVNVFIEVKKYAAGPGALLDSFTIANYNVSLLNFILENSVLINADAGQMISVQMTVTRQVGEQINLLIKEGSIFGCIKDVTGGGIYQSYNPEDYSALLHKYSYPFSTTDYDAILNDIRAMITFNRTGQNTRVGWIDQIKFKHAERMMEVILTSNKAINNGS
jgi:hypothetical protein